jgi:hypothetical protein
MKSRWSISLVLTLMLCLPLQGMASLLMHCSVSVGALSGQSSELQHEVGVDQPCHEAASTAQQAASADMETEPISCAGCDRHCTTLALPVTFKLAASQPSSPPRAGQNDPPRAGIVLDAQTSPPITFLL